MPAETLTDLLEEIQITLGLPAQGDALWALSNLLLVEDPGVFGGWVETALRVCPLERLDTLRSQARERTG